MSLTLQHGRPENMTERLKKEQKVYELLDLYYISNMTAWITNRRCIWMCVKKSIRS